MIESWSKLHSRSCQILRVLLESSTPVSGRRVADALDISPTTASKELKALLDRGLVSAQPAGTAVLWSANENNAEVRALRRELEASTRAIGDPVPVPADVHAWRLPLSGRKPVLKVVVLTALALEYAAVRSHFAEATQRRTRSGTRYDVGSVRGAHIDWEVYLAEIGMGNSGAAAEVAGAVGAFAPRLILFVGVAGGLKPADQNHGDVVVASAVYSVHSQKLAPHPDGGSQVLSRPLGVRAPYRLTQLVRAVGRTTWAADPLSRGQPQTTASAQPAVHLQPVVAGEVVLADPHSDLRKLIAERFSDAAAIDMESHGVYETAHRHNLPVLAVRGLSDLLGDKDPVADREWQPRAAANAAAFAIALLRHAEEDDLPPSAPPSGPSGGGAPIPPSTPQGSQGAGADVPAAEESMARLAPVLRPWWRRLRARRGTIADVAIAELAGRSDSPARWLGRIRHRPPAWLRDDDSGDAWALVARFADAHNSPHATRAYDEAARRAERTGEDTVAAVHRLQAALSTARRPSVAQRAPAYGGTDDVRESLRAEACRRLSDESLRKVSPLTAVLRAAVNEDADAILAAAPAAAHALGLPSEHLMTVSQPSEPRSADEDSELAAAVFAELADTDPDVVDQLRGDLLTITAYALLTRSEVSSALAVFTQAREFIPAAAGPLLGMARARLQRVGGPRPMVDSTIEVSSELAEVEELALLARDRRRAWNGDSGEAVAIAARARADSDPAGALRLVLPAPRGVATDAEARDPQVREAGALAAAFAGEHLLAVDLAAGISDPVERDLVRAIVLAQAPNVGEEVERAFRRALQAAPTNRPDQLVRALAGLVQLGAPLQPGQPGTVAPDLARLRDADAEAADIVEASAALRSGQPRRALVITRQYPTSVPAVEIAAEAAIAVGDQAEAVRILERAGRARGDEMLRTQAMFLAADAGRDEEAQRIATQLVLSHNAETRRRALEVRLTLAERGGRWEEVAELGRRLLNDNTLELSDVRRHQHVTQYRWAVASAEFKLRRPERARKALDDPDPLEPRNPSEAMLLLAVLHTATLPSAQGGTPAPTPTLGQATLERALAAAAAFPDDEEIVAAALGIVLTRPAPQPLPDALLAQVRALQDEFFNRFPDSTHLRRITISEDLSELVEHLRATFAPAAEQLADLARQVWLGLYPQGLLADVTGRSYAETLIKRVVGCHVAVFADPGLSDTEQTAARAAHQAGFVVVDTSTLVLLDHLGNRAQRLIAEFARVLFPASCRDDVLEARNGLALRSTGTLGWNPQQQRPQFTEFPPDVVNNWAEAGTRLAQRLDQLDIVPGPERDWSWDASLLLARRERSALWADDLALRHAARSEGVSAFGTLDLVTDLVKAGQLPRSVLDEVVEAFRRAYVVDLPLADRLLELAAAEGWKPEGYAPLLVARPHFWDQPADGFAQFSRLMRALPHDAPPESVAGWAGAAMTGLAWASPPPARPRAVAALAAWTVLNAGGEQVLPKVMDAGENVMAAAAPAGDLLTHTVSILAEMLGGVVPAAQVGVLFTRLLANLDQQRRARAMQAFLSLPR